MGSSRLKDNPASFPSQKGLTGKATICSNCTVEAGVGESKVGATRAQCVRLWKGNTTDLESSTSVDTCLPLPLILVCLFCSPTPTPLLYILLPNYCFLEISHHLVLDSWRQKNKQARVGKRVMSFCLRSFTKMRCLPLELTSLLLLGKRPPIIYTNKLWQSLPQH